MRTFPFDHELKKPIRFYPTRPKTMHGDVLEIGPGRGDLLFTLAKENPTKKFIAIELGKKRFSKLSENITKKKIENVLLIQGNAWVVVPQFFEEGMFEKIFVLFPDPWPKDRHVFRRLINLEFVWLLTYVLKPGGHFIFGTDVGWYAHQVDLLMEQIPLLKNILPMKISSSLEDMPPTFFEQKWRKLGREIYFLKYKKL